MKPLYFCFAVLVFIITSFTFSIYTAEASYHFSNYNGVPPIHIASGARKSPIGLTPDQIKTIYHLPKSGGHGTIAIITAYHDPTIESDLAIFNKQFSLPPCSSSNGCLEKHPLSSSD